MLKLAEWQFSRVLLLSGLWVLINLVLFGWQMYRRLVWARDQVDREGIAAVTFNVWLLCLLLLVPPLILLLAWYLARRRS